MVNDEMNILILGNQGYVGPELIKHLRQNYPSSKLIGYDCGFFTKHYTTDKPSPDRLLDVQFYGDVRNFDNQILDTIDVASEHRARCKL